MSQLEEKIKELEFPLLEDVDGEEYGEGTSSNAVPMVKALAGDGFTPIRRNKNRVMLGTFFCSVMDKRLLPNAQAVLPTLSLRLVHRKNNGIPFLRTKNQAAASLKQNRWSIVEIACEQGGKPYERRRAPTHTASRRTASNQVFS